MGKDFLRESYTLVKKIDKMKDRLEEHKTFLEQHNVVFEELDILLDEQQQKIYELQELAEHRRKLQIELLELFKMLRS